MNKKSKTDKSSNIKQKKTVDIQENKTKNAEHYIYHSLFWL